MASQLLALDLSTLIQDARRKYPEIKSTAEKSLADLKALADTSDSQLAADLRRRPEFIRPFLLACRTGNAKFATSSVISLQRLAALSGLAFDNLEELLGALQTCSSLGTDVQLRVLQIMPTLFQRYSSEITDTRLTTTLQLCFVLQASKNGVISNTAAATLQQVVNDVFSRIVSNGDKSDTVSPESAKTSWQAELDCHHVLRDLCLIAEGKQVQSLDSASISKDFAFELIGTILLNYTSLIPKYTNFVDVFRQHLLPLVLRIISSSASFNNTSRALRLVPPILGGFLELLPTELEMLMSILTYMLEPDAAPTWKRVMCMEAICNIYKDGKTVRHIYAMFDQREDHKAILQEQFKAISNMVSENPTAIGLGKRPSEDNMQRSDNPSASQGDQMNATAGTYSIPQQPQVPGISIGTSTLKVALVDQLDKAEAPTIPPTYIYALGLIAMNSLCESMALYILPFATSKSQNKKRRTAANKDTLLDRNGENLADSIPTNPLELTDRVDFNEINAASGLLQTCWPPLLSVYTTFFQANLDQDLFHSAIRAFQKAVQVAALFRLSEPRDAFLMTISKQSLPAETEKTNSSAREKVSNSTAMPRLTSRNLLCLRALVNLGIALGAVLDESWSIVLRTLQKADVSISYDDRVPSQGGPGIVILPVTTPGTEAQNEYTSEVAAVRAAASRMWASSSSFPSKQFLNFVDYIGMQFRALEPRDGVVTSNEQDMTSENPSSETKSHQRVLMERSSNIFVVDAYSQIIEHNHFRFQESTPSDSGWDALTRQLMRVVAVPTTNADMSGPVPAAVDAICKGIRAATFREDDRETPGQLIAYGFSALYQLIHIHSQSSHQGSTRISDGIETLNSKVLQTLRMCLERYGEVVSSGWPDACNLLLSVFPLYPRFTDEAFTFVPLQPLTVNSLKLAFKSLQIICSDLLENLPSSCLPRILHAVYLFSSQTADLNISLTATSLYQLISDNIWRQNGQLDLRNGSQAATDPNKTTSGALWLQLLTALGETSSSKHSEIRNSATQTLFQIVSSVAENLAAEDWCAITEITFLRLLHINQSVRDERETLEIPKLVTSLDETAVALCAGVCNLLAEYCHVAFDAEPMVLLWSRLVQATNPLLARGSLLLSAAIYEGFEKVLSAVSEDSLDFRRYTETLWTVCTVHNPRGHVFLDKVAGSDNQKALASYISCMNQLYVVSDVKQRSEVLERMLNEVYLSLKHSTATSFINDLSTTTPMQSECQRLLYTVYNDTDHSKTPILLSACAAVIALPESNETSGKRGPTFVALTNAVLELSQKLMGERAEGCRLHEQKATLEMFTTLTSILSHKTVWTKENIGVDVWRNATSVAVKAAEPLIALSVKCGYVKATYPIWKAVLDILDMISGPGSQDNDVENLLLYVDFDVSEFTMLYECVVPNLGAAQLPDEARQALMKILLLRSLIHEPHPDDSLDPSDRQEWPQPQRIGRVRELPANRRSKVCYVLLDMLFELVAAEKASDEHGRLAAAALPYLRLRTELVLKAYIFDQPLRGRMPCPLSQKQELLYLLRKAVALSRVDGGHVEKEEEKKSIVADTSTSAGTGIRNPVIMRSKQYVDSIRTLAIGAARVNEFDEDIKEALLDLIEI